MGPNETRNKFNRLEEENKIFKEAIKNLQKEIARLKKDVETLKKRG